MNDNFLTEEELNKTNIKPKTNWYDIIMWGLILSGVAIFLYWAIFK